jgi:hypothetical protein
MRKEGWLVSYKHPDPARGGSVTYLNEQEAYKDASDAIKGWASEELENLKHQDDPEEWAEERESLTEALSLIERKSFKEAYEEWRSYADDTDPGEDVLIEGTTVIV